MRLWHYKLIQYLPDAQLRAQWRELNSIFKNQPKHILINYVYEEKPEALLLYSWQVINEMCWRGLNFRVNSYLNMENYFTNRGIYYRDPCIKPCYFEAHNDRYLKQCFYNLQEKFDRGQKGFSREIYDKLKTFMIEEGLY